MPYTRAVELAAVLELHLELLSAPVDHVAIGEDPAVRVVDDARPDAGRRDAAERVRGRRPLVVVILTTAGPTLAAASMTADDSSMVTGWLPVCWRGPRSGGGDRAIEGARPVEHDDRAARGEDRGQERCRDDGADAGPAASLAATRLARRVVRGRRRGLRPRRRGAPRTARCPAARAAPPGPAATSGPAGAGCGWPAAAHAQRASGRGSGAGR